MLNPQVTVAGPRRCPRCHSTHLVPIENGVPPVNIDRGADRDGIILASWRVPGGVPKWHCRDCGTEFGDFKLDAALPEDEPEVPPAATTPPVSPLPQRPARRRPTRKRPRS